MGGDKLCLINDNQPKIKYRYNQVIVIKAKIIDTNQEYKGLFFKSEKLE